MLHLDTHYWRPGWVEPPKEEWVRDVGRLTAGDAWIMDGNYGGTLSLRLAACDTVVFLDMPRAVCLRRVLRRRWRSRNGNRPDMAPGCTERLTWDFLRWIWTYRRLRRPSILERLAAIKDDRTVVVLRSDRDMERWLAEAS